MDALKITGELRIQKWKRSVLVGEWIEKNLVTTLGKTNFAARVVGAGSPIAYLACGSGATPPAVGDTALVAETGRVSVSPPVSSGAVVTVAGVLGPGVGTGALAELGLFTASGSLTNRVKLSSAITKDADEQITITWTVTFN